MKQSVLPIPKGMPQRMEMKAGVVVGREVQLKASWPTGREVSCRVSVEKGLEGTYWA